MLTTPGATLTDGVVSMREISPDDAETLYRLRMDPLSRPMFRNPEVIPCESHQAMVLRYFRPDSRDCWFIIESERQAVGAIALYNLDEEGHTCECGRFAIEPESRGLGYGRRALKLLMEYAQATGLQRVRCEILSTNAVSLRLHRQAGFKQTAVREYGGRSFVELAADLDGHV